MLNVLMYNKVKIERDKTVSHYWGVFHTCTEFPPPGSSQ